MPREILKFFKAPRQAEDYEGDFPSTITARRSMFDMPRYKQGSFIADMSYILIRLYILVLNLDWNVF